MSVSNIFLDRAIAINIAVDFSKTRKIDSVSYELLQKYKRVLYETHGMSALHYTFEKVSDLGDKMISIDVDESVLHKFYGSQLDELILQLSGSISVKHAFKVFCKKSNQKESTIGSALVYIFKSLYVGLVHKADLFIWEPRLDLVAEVLSCLKIGYEIKESSKVRGVHVLSVNDTRSISFTGDVSRKGAINIFARKSSKVSINYKEFITENRQRDLLQLLINDNKFANYQDELIVLLSNLNHLKKKEITNSIDHEEMYLSVNKINRSILEIINDVINS